MGRLSQSTIITQLEPNLLRLEINFALFNHFLLYLYLQLNDLISVLNCNNFFLLRHKIMNSVDFFLNG